MSQEMYVDFARRALGSGLGLLGWVVNHLVYNNPIHLFTFCSRNGLCHKLACIS